MLTPLAVAETPDSRPPPVLLLRSSPVQVTTVRAGLESVVHPRRPADVAAWLVGTSCAMVGELVAAEDVGECSSNREDKSDWITCRRKGGYVVVLGGDSWWWGETTSLTPIA